MIERSIYTQALSFDWGRQMRFLTGPRQAGKTTLAQWKLKQEKTLELYYLWDLRTVRNRYKANELFFTADKIYTGKKLWVCFDEIHKMPKWKNILKGVYDQTHDHYQFIVTGSAKLNLMKRAGDSLSGRYFTFHVFPLCLGELKNAKQLAKEIPDTAVHFIEQRLSDQWNESDQLSNLLAYSGFPEPFLRQSKKFQAKWSRDYLDTVIQEDIGALTRIIDKEYLYDVYRLLPEMVGSPISYQSIASHIELSLPTIKNHLKRLIDFYLIFQLRPYSKNIKRSLLKAPKIYLYDWTHIKNPAARFENYVACELQSRLSLWNNTSGEQYHLFYTRNKEKQETDFLIVKEDLPWCLIESKYSDKMVAQHHQTTSSALGNIPVVQICREEGIAVQQKKNIYRVSASRFF